MKQTIKKMIPAPILHHALRQRDRIKLHATTHRDFPHQNLKAGITSDLLTLTFNNPDIARVWEEANKKISEIFGSTTALGGVNPGDRRALYYLVSLLKPENLLEVGTHIGASTIFLAEALSHVSPTARMTTVDILDVNDQQGPWKKRGLAMPPRGYLQRLGLADRVAFCAMSSANYLQTSSERFDLIFLDGDHAANTVYNEISWALRLLNKDGVILLHDFYPGTKPLFHDKGIIPGPFMAVDRIMLENPHINALPLGRLPWETKQGTQATSLALLTRQI
ncbi:MAG: class I SAM-dependent methyltransferase [Micavibrio aeruginosavorus]|uniref:Class I SAM-dependent methyltransferase n=1 Tax=Micavibrio aeruginosavorus TaxID=349221 RepID=A0A7T5UGV4_9BACT|nr:MAG: class I SAM-dependent methyltransferase [Micavibrio aeruginosavorus]